MKAGPSNDKQQVGRFHPPNACGATSSNLASLVMRSKSIQISTGELWVGVQALVMSLVALRSVEQELPYCCQDLSVMDVDNFVATP